MKKTIDSATTQPAIGQRIRITSGALSGRLAYIVEIKRDEKAVFVHTVRDGIVWSLLYFDHEYRVEEPT